MKYKYRVDLKDILYFLAAVMVLSAITFDLTSCADFAYGPQPETTVEELHREAIHGVVIPEPSPIDWDKDLDYQ